MLIKTDKEIPSSEITPKDVYLNRRKFMAGAAALAGAGLVGTSFLADAATKIQNVVKGPFGTEEKMTPLKDITSYNNFYEFSTDKYEPAERAKKFRTRPWTVKVEGLVQKPKTYDIDEIVRLATPEERLYRMRCVEGWSMVIPWVGFPLNTLIKQVEPTSKAKYVEFTTLFDPAQMPGQHLDVLDWPYIEGLRLDEAMHPLAILCFGLYGETLQNQNGAPVRVVVPWKYGFKSAKSIVKIRVGEMEPLTAWHTSAPHVCGF
ncbi:MAG: protein-methionine-sulfoxide reductase catalytic subunit MsrP [Candidatus Korobacteraceae bacterium]